MSRSTPWQAAQFDERDRQLAMYRNVAGWSSVSLAILAFFWAVFNSFQTQGVRVAAVVAGAALSIGFSLLNLVAHWTAFGVHAPVLLMAVLVANIAPAVFWLAATLATEEYQFAQNKL